MDGAFEEDFSRPAKRRRISHHEVIDVFSSSSGNFIEAYGASTSSRGLPTSSISPTSGTGLQESSQTNANHETDEELAVVYTSDNEEILLEDDYDDIYGFDTTISAQSHLVQRRPLPYLLHITQALFTLLLERIGLDLVPNRAVEFLV